MPIEPMTGLDKRKATIMRAIVREYVRSGQPVGSKTLAQRYRLKVSAATIRNDMGTLEELGFIVQPYTSAGRIPTDRGYRWFVDNWPGNAWPDLPERQQRTIDGAYKEGFRDLDEVLDSTSKLLSQVTEATAVVSAPPGPKNKLSRLELFPRADGRVTLLVVADTGVVERGVVEMAAAKDPVKLSALAHKLNEELSAVPFEDLAAKLRKAAPPSNSARSPKKIDGDRTIIADELDRMVGRTDVDRIFRGGTANILSPDKFSDLATAHDVVGALEQPPILSGLLNAVRESQAVVVFIGQELEIEQMRACAVILAPYGVDERQGTLGVVGPTRMDYPHTISAVEAVARSLSRLLEG